MTAAVTARTRPRWPLAVLAAAALLLGPLSAFGPAGAQQDGPMDDPVIERREGRDRFATAAAVSRAAFPGGADTAFVATGGDFPDALASGPAATAAGAPVLLVGRDALPDPTREELQRLDPERVVVLGGTDAVSAEVEARLDALTGGGAERIAGTNRFVTAARVSAATFAPGVGVAYIATGAQPFDALAGGAAGAAGGAPVLLVGTDIPAPTAEELRRLRPGSIRVLGGEQAVPAEVARDLAAFTDGEVDRLAGPDRYATAAALARVAFAGEREVVFLATGEGFADALAGAPAAGRADAPVLLTQRDCLPAPTVDAIDRLAPGRVVLLGGTAAVGEPVEELTPCEGVEPTPEPEPTTPEPTPTPTRTPEPTPEPEPSEPPDPVVTVVAEGLDVPWDVAFTPDGRAYVSERDTGRLLLRETDGTIEEVQRLDVNPEGEGGFLGLALSPDFDRDGLLYAFYTTDEDNRIVRFRPGEPPKPILTGLPRARIHDAGRIRFGPDGMLYAATGDAAVSERSQDPDSRAGKILRMTPDGDAPQDNPAQGSLVYALGLRDPQGLAWDAQDRLYATEFGPDRDDEINLVEPGGNYGWPEVTGQAGDDRFVDPLLVRQPPEASWSGAEILLDGAVPQWEGDLFAAALRGERLYRLDLAPDGGVAGVEELLVGEYGRLRVPVQAPDGSLWVTTSNGDDADRILRLAPPE